MRTTRFLAWMLAIGVLLNCFAMGAHGWSLNPFASSTTEPKPANPPAKTSAPSKGKAEPAKKGLFSGITNPFSSKKQPAKKATVPPVRKDSQASAAAAKSNKSKQPSQSWFSSMFHPEPKPPKSMNDFMSLPRPE